MQTTATTHGRTPPPSGVNGVVRGGFSIPELLVVLLIVSVVAYMAIPAIEVERFRMDGAARGAMAALVSAQRQAVQRQHDVVVVFDTAATRLRIHQDRNSNGAVDAEEPVRLVTLDEGVRFAVPETATQALASSGPVTFTESQDGLPALRFLRNGSGSEEGAFYLTSARSFRSGEHASDARAVRVDRPTGRVTWYRHEPPGWVEAF